MEERCLLTVVRYVLVRWYEGRGRGGGGEPCCGLLLEKNNHEIRFIVRADLPQGRGGGEGDA